MNLKIVAGKFRETLQKISDNSIEITVCNYKDCVVFY